MTHWKNNRYANVTSCKSFDLKKCRCAKYPLVQKCILVQKWPSVQKWRRAKVSPRAKRPSCKSVLVQKSLFVQKWHSSISVIYSIPKFSSIFSCFFISTCSISKQMFLEFILKKNYIEAMILYSKDFLQKFSRFLKV